MALPSHQPQHSTAQHSNFKIERDLFDFDTAGFRKRYLYPRRIERDSSFASKMVDTWQRMLCMERVGGQRVRAVMPQLQAFVEITMN